MNVTATNSLRMLLSVPTAASASKVTAPPPRIPVHDNPSSIGLHTASARIEAATTGLVIKLGLLDQGIEDVLSRAQQAGLSQSELGQLRAILKGLPPQKAAVEADLVAQLLDGPGPRRA